MLPASLRVFDVADLPIDGVLMNPYGPQGPIALTSDECARIARRLAR